MLALFLPHIAKMICTAPRFFALLGDGILSSCSFPRAGAAIDRCSLKYFKTHFVFAPVALRKPIPVPEPGSYKVQRVCFSGDGRRLAADRFGTVVVRKVL